MYNSDGESGRDVSRKVLPPLVPVKEQKTSWKNNCSIFASLFTFAAVICYNEENSGVEPKKSLNLRENIFFPEARACALGLTKYRFVYERPTRCTIRK